jgi:hypothetical protein
MVGEWIATERGVRKMACDFKTFNGFVDLIADARHPVMIRGRHGIGKSELVYQYANRKGLPVIERRVSQMTEGDLVGLPVIDGNRTAWNPPDWFKDACERPVVLFLDEVDRGTQEVRQGIFQLTDSRTINGHKLHPDTIIFAAVNGGIHASQYAVNDMDPAELDRWTAFDVEPSVGDWLDYGRAGNVLPLIVDFINDQSSHLEHKGEFEPGKVYPSRRSWKRLSDALSKAGMLEGDEWKSRLDVYFNLASGYIGMEAAIASRDYFKNLEKVVTVDDILAGRLDGLKGYKLGEYTALADKLVASGRLKKDLPKDQLENVMRLFLRMPSEAGMKFYTDCSKTPGAMDCMVMLHTMTVDGKSIKDHVVALLGGAKKKK